MRDNRIFDAAFIFLFSYLLVTSMRI